MFMEDKDKNVLVVVEDEKLREVGDLLRRHESVIGKKKLDLFLSAEKDEVDEGWATTKMVVKGDGEEVKMKRMAFLGRLDGQSGESGETFAFLAEYSSRIPVDADAVALECLMFKQKGRDVITFRTIAPVKYILGTSGDKRVEEFSTIKDKEFERLVPSGLVVEQVFIDVESGKTKKMLSAYIDMESADKQVRDLGDEGVLSFDARDLLQRQKMRKVERKLDGELVVMEGYWVEGREFEWESIRVVEG